MTVSGSCLSRTPRRNDPLDEEVLPEDQIAADRATEEPREDLRARIRLGQPQVLPITKVEKRSGWRVATEKPMGPPQSWTIMVTSRRSSWSNSFSKTPACSVGV